MAFLLSAFADEAGPTCAEQIAGLKQAGLKWIDIRNIDGHNIVALPVEHAKKVREQLDAAGIKVGMYGSPLGKIDIADDFAGEIEKLKHLGNLRPILGATAVRIFSYYNKGNRPATEFRKEAISRLKQLKALAKDLGLVLYHENERHIFGDRGDDVLAIAQELRDTPGSGRGATFQMIFDFGNYVVGGESPWDNWVKLRDTTDAFHFKDNEGTPDGKNHHVPAGQGQGQIAAIIADAVKRKFSGPATVEPHLQHSASVLATGPGGVPNQAYSQMTANESFQIACKAAKDLVLGAGAVIG